MLLMIIAALVILGLCFGSFVNALVWRLHEQEHTKSKKKLAKLSISKGRSMCPDCEHELSAVDLIPVFSWIFLGGKCHYCRKPISIQYPLVELLTAGLFVASYVWWPIALSGAAVVSFALWLVLLVGLMALLIYDVRWMLLPNRIIYPLAVVAASKATIDVLQASDKLVALVQVLLAVGVGGGLFYILYQVSNGKWIGGGDIRLGWLLGAAVGTLGNSVLVIFLASLLGSFVSVPLLLSKKLSTRAVIPFGPFLIIAAIIVELFGATILHWYRAQVLGL